MPQNQELSSLGQAGATKYTAKFVRGTFHALRELTWDPGRTIVVSEAQMLHLEEHAVEHAGTSDGETLVRDRFEFAPYEGPEPVGYRFPTEAEAAKAEAIEESLERSRRIALAKARVDEEMAEYDRNLGLRARTRTRS